MDMELTLETFDYFIRQKYRTVHNGNWSPKQPIRKVQLWDGRPWEMDTLYLLPKRESYHYTIPKDPNLHILYILSRSVCGEQGYYLLTDEEDPLCALNGVLDIYMSYQHWQEEVLRYDQYAHDLQALLDCTAAYLKIDLRIISKYFENLFSDVHNEILPWNEILDERGQMTLLSIQQLYTNDPNFDQTFLEKGLIEYPSDDPEFYHMYFYNIFSNNTYIGRILIYLKKEAVDSALLPLLSSYCTHVENCFLYLHHREHPSAFYAHLHEYLYQMFQFLPVEQNTVLPLLQKIGWTGKQRFQILRFETKGYGTSAQAMDYFCPQIERSLPHCIAFFAEKGIYCIHNTTIDSQNLFEEKLPYFLRDNLFQAGISCTFCDFFQAPYYAREAVTSLRLGQELAPEKWIHPFEEYAFAYCMKQVTQEFPREDLCHPALLTLLNYDKENPGIDLYKTLHQYLACHFNASQAAEKLHIHRTTFLYRLKKINELTEIDLDSWDSILHYMLSFQLLERVP